MVDATPGYDWLWGVGEAGSGRETQAAERTLEMESTISDKLHNSFIYSKYIDTHSAHTQSVLHITALPPLCIQRSTEVQNAILFHSMFAPSSVRPIRHGFVERWLLLLSFVANISMNMSAQRCHRRWYIHNAKRQACIDINLQPLHVFRSSIYYLSLSLARLFLATLASRRSAECGPNAMYRSVSWATTSPLLLANARQCQPFPSRL